MEKREMSEKESLAIITEMILKTKSNVKNRAGGPTLIWGYATLITSILIYAGWELIGQQWIMYGWILIPVIGLIGMLFLNKKEKTGYVKTYLDKVISYIWIVFGVMGALVSACAFLISIPILFVISIFMSGGITLTGYVTGFKQYLYFGCAGVLLSFLLTVVGGSVSVLIFAAIFVVTMIIPGHIVNTIKNPQLSESINTK